MCNCGKNNCQKNSCNNQYVCRNTNVTKCVVNGTGTHCYTEDKSKCHCVRCAGRNYIQNNGFNNYNNNGYGYCYQENKCGQTCKPKCCNICPQNCADKYKWAPKRISCEEKKTCTEIDVKFGWNNCEPKKCHKKKSCSSSSSDSSKSEHKKKWCCKSCKKNYEKKYGKY